MTSTTAVPRLPALQRSSPARTPCGSEASRFAAMMPRTHSRGVAASKSSNGFFPSLVMGVSVCYDHARGRVRDLVRDPVRAYNNDHSRATATSHRRVQRAQHFGYLQVILLINYNSNLNGHFRSSRHPRVAFNLERN